VMVIAVGVPIFVAGSVFKVAADSSKFVFKVAAAADPVAATACIWGVVAVVIDWARRAMMKIRRAREAETERQRQKVQAEKVGRCRLTVATPVSKAPMVSALETSMP